METTIYRFVFRYSLVKQIQIVALTLASFPFLYYSLELPKLIVNDAIGEFQPGTTFLGYPFEQVPYLFLLSGIFLSLVFVNGIFKFHINTLKGLCGERMLRRLRYELYSRVLRFPIPHFKKMSAGEIIPMITAEVEPLGGFIGDAIAQPVFQGGTLLVYLVFIFVQDPVLGAAAIALYPLQGYVIPILQRKVNQLGKQRVRTMRQISDKIGESVAGIQEIHNHDTSAYHLADLSNRYGDVFDIRFEIYQRKFFIKFLNNFINQLTPFFFYSIGGYLVIRGDLSFGALVAVLAAYKDLAGPWRELLMFYQQMEDARIKYGQIIEQFQPPQMLDPNLLTEDPQGHEMIKGTLRFSNVSFGDGSGSKVLDSVNVSLPFDQPVAIVGAGGGGVSEFAMLSARLLQPTSGAVLIGEQDIAQWPESVTGRRISFAGSSPALFAGSLRDNLLYGLRHRPLAVPAYGAKEAARWRKRRGEAIASGNSEADSNADWVDYAEAGSSGPEDLKARLLDVLVKVDLDHDVYEFGLYGTIDPVERPDVATRILEARSAAAKAFERVELKELVETFDWNRYNGNASVAENLLFGTPVGKEFALETLAEHPYVRRVLTDVGLTRVLAESGQSVAETLVEIFADLPPGHALFERFSFIGADTLKDLDGILQHVNRAGLDSLSDSERSLLISLVFKLIPARHRLGILTDALKERIIEARLAFAANLPADLKGSVEFFDPVRYNAAATIQDNILFGRLAQGQAQTAGRIVRNMVAGLVEELNLREAILEVGLDYQVGVSGLRLSGAQRLKTGLARALLKDPEVLVLDEATNGLDSGSQAKVHQAILQSRHGRALIWAVHRPAIARDLGYAVVLQNGQVVEHGDVKELDHNGSALNGLLNEG